ncbi:hypothetical protein LguiB_026628 [Lonicera macranthoides]
MSTLKTLYYLPFFILLVSLSFSIADDLSVLQKLATSLGGTAPKDWTGTDICSAWSGIDCDNSGQVTSINLRSKNLQGTLPTELNNLSQLKTLALQRNSLNGALPSFANMTTLEQIFLYSNDFSSVPSDFLVGLTNLQLFSISHNPSLQSWEVPIQLRDSSSLSTLSARNASLVGSIPDIFGSFPNLQSLRLSYNNLTGVLPKSLGGSEIQNLWINNQALGLSGPIDVLSSMTQLYQVWLHANAFTGPIPDLSNCQNLFDLQLRDNQFTGVVPPVIMNLPILANISLQNNKLQGPLPVFKSGVRNTLGSTNSFCLSIPGPCDPQVTVLLEVAGAIGYPMNLAESWQGNDACRRWTFISCDSSGKNVTTVNFGKQQYVGTISPSFRNLTSLRSLSLNDNHLTGSIPNSLMTLTQLQTLDVSNNNLRGPIPVFPPSVKFTSSGNLLLGQNISTGDGGGVGRPPSSDRNNSSGGRGGSSKGPSVSAGMIAGVVVAVLVFIGVIIFVSYKCYVKRHHQRLRRVAGPENGNEMAKNSVMHSGDQSEIPVFEGGNDVISIQVLRQVTNNFSEDNISGRGGFGVVYKGELQDGTKIAVKRMETGVMGTEGMKQFQAEIAVLTKVRHRHLVALLGYCINGNERLLVYEYMPQGTLTQHLFECEQHGYNPLSWKQRVTIALDVGRGVEYLHSLAQQSFIHRDLKPSNILLGDDMRAKVADFGLVKNTPDGKFSITTRLAGTFGYLAPEYAANTGRVTAKVDVYAFGVVLMEIITGRKALDETMPQESSHLETWFRRVLTNKDSIRNAIDTTLDRDEETFDSICKVVKLACHCTTCKPLQRPDMGHVVNMLRSLVEQWKPSQLEEEGEGEGEGEGEEICSNDLHMPFPQVHQRFTI